jgi:hypothetical protein
MSPDTGRYWYVVSSITGRISDNVPALIELLPALGIILVGIAIIAGGELLQMLMDMSLAAQWRLGEDAHRRRPRIRDWRIYTKLEKLRRFAGGLLRGRKADVRRQGAKRIRARHARQGVPALQKTAYQTLPFREFAREQERALG